MSNCPYTRTRRDADMPLSSYRNESSPAVLEKGITKYMNLLKGDPKICTQYMEGGSLAQLAHYADRNTSVIGYLMNKVLSTDLKMLATRQEGHDVFPKDCTLYVSIKVDNVMSTKQTFSSNVRLYEHDEGSGHTKRTGTEWTGYGANLDVVIAMEFRPRNMVANDSRVRKLEYEQHVVIAPDRDRRHAYSASSFAPPAAQEFDIGAVVNLLHDNKQLTDAELRDMVMLTTVSNHFPRHNLAVQEIEAALAVLGPFVDMVARFLATLPPFRAASSRHSDVAMPWGPARHELKKGAEPVHRTLSDEAPVKNELPDGDAAMGDADTGDYIGARLGNALDQFHRDQCNELIDGMGVLGDLVQRLALLKAYAVHFGHCYASIDHYMVRAFMKGIGDHNAVLFEKRQPLDPLLHKIALHQADRGGVGTARCEIDVPGISLEVKVQMPGMGYYTPLMAIPCVEPNFSGSLSFGLGSKPIPVTGEYTRQVFILPTESDGGEKPSLAVSAEAMYKNKPVVVVIGTPDGKRTDVKTVFLLVDTWCMWLAISVGAIPSNKAFAKAMSVLPPEMADFAAAIRACDIAEGGLDLHVIYLAPVLASALGVEEDDLMGDPKWMKQLVGLMRGGVSLQALAQRKARPAAEKDGWQDVPSPKVDLAKLKDMTADLEKEMLAQGAIDHYVPPVTRSAQPAFTSLGADDDDSPPAAYRSMAGACAAEPAPAPMAVDTAPTAAAAPTSGAAEGGAGAGDAAVDELASDLKDLKADDDRDFMNTLMNHAEKTMANSEAILGAKLTIPDCATNCYFAKGKVPDGKTTSDYMGPGTNSKWQVRPNLDAASKTIRRMLTAHAALGKPVPTTRMSVFGLLVEWETNLFKGLMSGSIDPTKILLGAYKGFAKLQQ
jgi:hypothetical protein